MPVIQFANSKQRESALRLLTAQDSNGQDTTNLLLELMDRGELDPKGLLVLINEERICGAILVQALPGSLGIVWPARFDSREAGAEDLSGVLLQAALDNLRQHGSSMIQALVRVTDRTGIQQLMSHGFQRLADLVYLVWPCAENPFTDESGELQFERYSAELHNRFVNVIQRSYEGTLDCPELNGRRSVDDVMQGYRATGQFSPDRWLLVTHNFNDVGCLLLADHPQTNQWELVYMGVVLEVRGRGWGWKLVQHAQRLTHAAGRSALSVAVDSGNLPALRVYQGSGFIVIDSRRALFYELKSNVQPCALG